MNDQEKLLNYLKAGNTQTYANSGGWVMPDWVPSKVRMLRTVRPDGPLTKRPLECVARIGEEYEVESGKWGAISAKTPGGLLGLRPYEFEVVEWVENPHRQCHSCGEVTSDLIDDLCEDCLEG